MLKNTDLEGYDKHVCLEIAGVGDWQVINAFVFVCSRGFSVIVTHHFSMTNSGLLIACEPNLLMWVLHHSGLLQGSVALSWLWEEPHPSFSSNIKLCFQLDVMHGTRSSNAGKLRQVNPGSLRCTGGGVLILELASLWNRMTDFLLITTFSIRFHNHTRNKRWVFYSQSFRT